MQDLNSQSPAERAISVTELNRLAKSTLEGGLSKLWIEGEISNLARPASGHVYFSLKDDRAQIRCAWFKQRQRGPAVGLENGDQVLAFGQVSVYEARGDYQLIVDQIEDAGEGELRRQFEQLKKALSAEGLFAEERKARLPTLPTRIGIISSPSGAAVHDILTVLKRRFSAIPVTIYPVAVQGQAAVAQIIDALATAERRGDCDVLILSRGGGSLEDLWSFNDEAVARAIANCNIPVVSGVGHEIDFSIADFVADVRAPTPSAAAELVVPDASTLRQQLTSQLARLMLAGRRSLESRQQQIDWLGRRLARLSPENMVAAQRERLRNLNAAALSALKQALSVSIRRFDQQRLRLVRQSPATNVQRALQRYQSIRQRLHSTGQRIVVEPRARLALAAATLDSVSPLATLQRGFSIISDASSGQIVTDASELNPSATIKAVLRRGRVIATVKTVEADYRPGQSGEDNDD